MFTNPLRSSPGVGEVVTLAFASRLAATKHDNPQFWGVFQSEVNKPLDIMLASGVISVA